ncbi:MAG: GMC family oxidoreductase [Planctomycetota bacterium]
MITDLAQHVPESLPRFDVVVVGSGPAGGTLANELAGKGLRVAVLESGRRSPTARGDALRAVEFDGLPIKEYSRERVLGGASTTWAGLSSPLDPIDFESRPVLSRPGWPIERAALVPYWQRAAERFRFPEFASFDPSSLADLRAKGDVAPTFAGIDEKVFLARTEPQDFGREFQAPYEGDDVHLLLDATVLELVPDESRRRVAAVKVRNSEGRELEVRGERFVLATGGIENARLLLGSAGFGERGVGNEHDQVGRCFMNHPKNYHGVLTLRAPVQSLPYFFGCMYRGFAGYAGLRLDEETQRGRGLLNSYVRFEPLFPWSDSEGVESLVLLAKRSKFLLDHWRRRGAKGDAVVELRDYSETGDDSDLQNARKKGGDWVRLGWNVVADAPRVARYATSRLFERRRPKVRRVRLRNFMEMEPDPSNRVVLSDARDADGRPVPRVASRCTELDRRSLVELHEVLRNEFARTGLGDLESSLSVEGEWPIDQDASHHLGTTRMGDDPRTSVVDRDLRVHGVANLHVAGGSVFATSGCANPTYTIVALSIRLAEHLVASTRAGAVR